MRKELIVMRMRGKGKPWFCRVGRGLWYVRNLSKAGVARPGSPPVLLWPMNEGWFVHLSSCHLKVMGTLNCDVTRSCCVGQDGLELDIPVSQLPRCRCYSTISYTLGCNEVVFLKICLSFN